MNRLDLAASRSDAPAGCSRDVADDTRSPTEGSAADKTDVGGVLVCCSLCGDTVSAAELTAHVKEHDERLRDYVLEAIRQRDPEWVDHDG